MNGHALPDERITERPVLSKNEIVGLAKKVLAMTEIKSAQIEVQHTCQFIVRMTNGEIMSSDLGDNINISFNRGVVGGNVRLETNQITDSVLRQVAQQFATMRDEWGDGEALPIEQPQTVDTLPAVQLWHDTTVQAMRTTSTTVLPDILLRTVRERLHAAGMVGFVARSRAIVNHAQVAAFSEETDSEIALTVRTPDGTSSGWGGQAARDWTRIDSSSVIARAVDICRRGVGAQAFEPGRRTAILTADAVAQVMRYFAWELDGVLTVPFKGTAFTSSTHPGGARYSEQMFDPRITMSSDPADPDGGYSPYFGWGFANFPGVWVERGKLKELAWQPGLGRARYSDTPTSIRFSGGNTTIEEMISGCEEGIFVNQLSDVELLDIKTGMLSGVTRGGCFYVKRGKIDRPIKNLRFLDSPFFMLNKILALGKPQRAAFGYTPPSRFERFRRPAAWPRPPMIVPPMMIQDFNFNALADDV
jgi:predicted Zn-dependent protease